MQEVHVTDMSYNRFVSALEEYATFHQQTYHSDTAEACELLLERLEGVSAPDKIVLSDEEHDALETALNSHYDEQQNAHDFCS